ncbi:prepilin-type N-terminal cleavage/methylation domain-containing protein [Neobacillus drentensis]|uniref:prepilin-type N-terminal cleavage/methylation domain-containing protein n=1 Tax=Neobacillus drentensis TaxID=220684 RepID=UPI001F3CADBA|nr:prepilin-type N-terminal cleavage/methylation domain-containing protein [Neobacillus drentensis]ULT55842.1 prepilin-type N-terminal cleavage/methylation domain-containing protein [Neobacillus drentensis]
MNEKGMTLIEILASIVILSIIIVSMLTMIVQSSQSNTISKKIMSATYVAESAMEELNGTVAQSTDLTTTFPIELNKLTKSDGNPKYTLIVNPDCQTICKSFETTVPGYYVYIELTSPPPITKVNTTTGNRLVNVIVRVKKNKTTAKIEAQMEMLLSWKKV